MKLLKDKILIDEMKTDTKIMVDIPEQKIRLGHWRLKKTRLAPANSLSFVRQKQLQY